MGSDISGYLEIREEKTSEWKKRSYIPCERCYNMFGLLNGFRNDINIPPISESRGLPLDLSDYVQNQVDNDPDVIAPSHLYWEDFEKYNYNQSVRVSKRTLILDEKTGELIKSKHITPLQIIYKCGWDDFLAIMKDLAKLYGNRTKYYFRKSVSKLSKNDKAPSIQIEYWISNEMHNSNDIKFEEKRVLEINIFKHYDFYSKLMDLIGQMAKKLVKLPENRIMKIDRIDINKAFYEIERILNKEKKLKHN